MLRRSFLQLGALGAVIGGASLELFQQAKATARQSWERFIAQPAFQRPRNAATVVLEVTTAPIMVLGQSVERGCIRQLDGQRGYTTAEAGGINLELINQLPVPTTVHWHGLILPNAMDGVPFVTQPPILRGNANASTTRWCRTAPFGCIPTTDCRPKASWLSPL